MSLYHAKITVKDTLSLTYDFPNVVTDSLGNKPSGDLGFGILTDIISQLFNIVAKSVGKK